MIYHEFLHLYKYHDFPTNGRCVSNVHFVIIDRIGIILGLKKKKKKNWHYYYYYY